jgi:hypothetical protein
MSAGAYDAASFDRGARSSSAVAALLLRARVFIARPWLDRRIAAGDARAAGAALELRARQLGSAGVRLQLARELRSVVEYAERESSPAFSAVVINRPAVSRGRHALLGLAERLERQGQVSPRGVALARVLLTDGLGPLFNPNSQHTVVQAVWSVEDALEGQHLAGR